MANEMEYEAGAPKKADVLIRSTQHIALKQEELGEQTRQIAARLDEAMELFSKNNQDSAYIVKESGEIFNRLQSENSVLKQELLYLAKQSENIYAGLAEKINELSEQNKSGEQAVAGLANRINDVAESSAKGEGVYAEISEKLTELAAQNKRNEDMFAALTEKLAALDEKIEAVASRAPVAEVQEKVVAKAETAEADNSEILNKLNYITEQLRRTEGAHSMLADKFEILSMRVEQFGFESAKSPAYGHAPAAYAQPVHVTAQNIDYDLLAQKVADLVSTRESVSPDYIASKVAEQIILPELEAANVKVSVDTESIAKRVAELVDIKAPAPVAAAPVNASINLDEEALAERIAGKIGAPAVSESAVTAVADIDEESLAERIANKLGGVRATPVAGGNIDTDELADAIALKVGSLKAEDFEILVDDEGCTSISKEIANKLDYGFISNVVADKLREALDLVAANAPDYEEMAERISEKITVAGINEDAIADKAAAVLSNYLPDFDTDEITDKVTGAVIDVVNAMPQPTLDSEEICNVISQRLIESQEDHDYDIVIDDDGINRITELVSEQLEKNTGERFDKVEEELSKINGLLTPEQSEEEQESATEETENVVEEKPEEDYAAFTQIVAEEIEKGTASRFDKVEEDIRNLADIINGIVVEDEPEPEVEYEEYDEDEDYGKLSEAVAAEVEKSVSSRFDGVEESLAKLTELLTADDEQPEDEEEAETEDVGEVEEEDYGEAVDYTELSEAVAAEVEKRVAVRFDSVEAKLTELLTPELVEEEQGEGAEEDYTALSEAVAAEVESRVAERFESVEAKLTELLTPEPEDEQEEPEEDVTALSEAVANQVENAVVEVSARLDAIEQQLAKLAEIAENGVETEIVEESSEEDYNRISEAVAAEIEKGVSARLDSVEENVTKIAEIVANGAAIQSAASGEPEERDYSLLSRVVAAEIMRGVDSRLGKVEEDLAKITDYVEGDVPVETNSRMDKIVQDLARISTFMEGELSVETAARFDKIEEDLKSVSRLAEQTEPERQEPEIARLSEELAEIKQLLSEGVSVKEDGAQEPEIARLSEELAEIKQLLSEGVSVKEDGTQEPEIARLSEELAEIKQLLSEGVSVKEDGTQEPEIARLSEELAEIKALLAGGMIVREDAAAETAAAQAAEPVEEDVEEEPLVTVSDLVKPEQTEPEEEEFEEEEEEADDDEADEGDFLIDVLDMDKFSDDELMPGEASEFGGVDFANMMKFKRSFIARIIQSSDEYKQYYGEVKHALLSYKKVNSNVAWSNERFNKGRETIARMKIRGKTLVVYLALDPNNYKTSVYHHIDVSDNKSVAGTPMMIKVKSNLGVRKAIRLIDEMLALRNGEKKEISERDYAAMYPYETIEELIEEGLVKDVRKK